ncbi:MAG: hypothetical protein ABSH47_09995 [Bryobacteraceae bacterium]|jgi:DNA-binding beta-propeller fold protein YncE
MINGLFSVRAARIGLALQCLVGCSFLAGCSKKADVWVAGGKFLVHGTESYKQGQTLTLTAQTPALDTQVLLFNYQDPELDDILDALANGKVPVLAHQLWVPPTTGDLQMYNVLSGSGTYTATNISTGGKIALALAQDDKYVYAAHPFAAAVSVIDKSKLSVTATLQMSAGQQPSLIGKDVGLYVISNGTLFKLSGGSNPVVLGSAPMDDGVDDIAVGQGFVVVPSIGNDKIYVFVDDASQGNPHLWWTINTQNGSPARVAISRNSPTAYVTLMTGTEGTAPGIVDVIPLAARDATQIAHVTVGPCPGSIAVAQVEDLGSWEDRTVLVGNQCDSTLSRIHIDTISTDSNSPATVDTIPLPGVPNAIATH